MMKQKLISLLFLLVCFAAPSAAQFKTVMLLPEYVKGTVYLRSGQIVTLPMNYDAGQGFMFYHQGGENMVLTNVQAVDSISIGGRRFLPVKSRFYEVISYTPDDVLLIDWRLEKVQIGYRGAYGQVSQTKTHSVNLSLLQGHEYNPGVNTVVDTDLYRQKNRNHYYILQDGKMRKFRNKKTLLKLFPQQQEAIEGLIDELDTDFTQPESVIALMQQVLGL